jgi:hypothetical protein
MDPVTSPLIHKDSGRLVPHRSGRAEFLPQTNSSELAFKLIPDR